MPLTDAAAERAIPLVIVAPAGLAEWLSDQDEPTRAWVSAAGFEAASGSVLIVPAADGGISVALVGWGREYPPPGAFRARGSRAAPSCGHLSARATGHLARPDA